MSEVLSQNNRPGGFTVANSHTHTQRGEWEFYPYALWTKSYFAPLGWVAPV